MKKVIWVLKYIRAFFPSKLPLGSKEFELFADDVVTLFGLPNLRSYRHAVASMILHLPPLINHKSKYYFAASIRKAMANQVAYEKIQEYKAEEKEAASSEIDDGCKDAGPRSRIN